MSRNKPYLNGDVIYERIYTAIIYKDSTSYDYNEVIKKLCSYDEFAYIVHDNDGVKTHTHILFRFPVRKQINTVSDELGIPENYIKWRSSFRDSFQYLTHENSKNMKLPEDKRKFVYPRKLIVSSFTDDEINKFYSKTQEEKVDEEISQVLEIINKIEDNNLTRYRDLIKWSCKHKCWSTLRRGGQHFIKAFDEVQNERYHDEFQKKHNKKMEDGKYKKAVCPDGFTPVDDEQLEF